MEAFGSAEELDSDLTAVGRDWVPSGVLVIGAGHRPDQLRVDHGGDWLAIEVLQPPAEQVGQESSLEPGHHMVPPRDEHVAEIAHAYMVADLVRQPA